MTELEKTTLVNDLTSINSPWVSHPAADTLFDNIISALEQGKKLCANNQVIDAKFVHMSDEIKSFVYNYGANGVLIVRDETEKQYLCRQLINDHLIVYCNTES